MRIGFYVSDDVWKFTLNSSPRRIDVERIRSGEILFRAISAGDIAALAVDPLEFSDSAWRRLVEILCTRELPVIVITPLSHTVVARILELAALTQVSLVILGHDAPAVLRIHLQNLHNASVRALFMGKIARQLGALPLQVRPEVLSLFADVRVPKTVLQFAHGRLGLRRRLERSFESTDLHGVKRLLTSARVASAADMLIGASAREVAVAERTGFSSVASLRSHSLRIFGYPLGKAIREKDCSELARDLVEFNTKRTSVA